MGTESEFGLPISTIHRLCLVYFALMPLEKFWISLPPAMGQNAEPRCSYQAKFKINLEEAAQILSDYFSHATVAMALAIPTGYWTRDDMLNNTVDWDS